MNANFRTAFDLAHTLSPLSENNTQSLAAKTVELTGVVDPILNNNTHTPVYWLVLVYFNPEVISGKLKSMATAAFSK